MPMMAAEAALSAIRAIAQAIHAAPRFEKDMVHKWE